MDSSQLPEARVGEMIAKVVAYFRQERALYHRASGPLAPVWKSSIQDHFSKSLLDTVKTITLGGARIPPPPFYSEAVAMSGGHFSGFVSLSSGHSNDITAFSASIALRPPFQVVV